MIYDNVNRPTMLIQVSDGNTVRKIVNKAFGRLFRVLKVINSKQSNFQMLSLNCQFASIGTYLIPKYCILLDAKAWLEELLFFGQQQFLSQVLLFDSFQPITVHKQCVSPKMPWSVAFDKLVIVSSSLIQVIYLFGINLIIFGQQIAQRQHMALRVPTIPIILKMCSKQRYLTILNHWKNKWTMKGSKKTIKALGQVYMYSAKPKTI